MTLANRNPGTPMNPRRLLLPFLLTPSLALAQTWAETGDAGQLPSSAQIATGSGPLATITGNLGGDVDMFLIDIDSPTTFTAACSGITDSVLWLFDERGVPVLCNDDNASGNAAVLAPGFVRSAGRYWLAVAGFGTAPRTPAGQIWVNTQFSTGVPDGAGRFECLSHWLGIGATGAYSIALTGAAKVQPRIVLPDTHHLAESATVGSIGATSFFTTTGSRFQLLYERSHFVSAGVASQLTIDKLLFRTEDGEVSPVAATWNNAVVTLSQTAMTAAGMSTNFATNSGAATNTGSFTTTVRMSHARGCTPNDFNIAIELGSGYPLVNSPALPNLLVDVILLPNPAVNPAVPLAAVQDTTGTAATIRGAAVVGASNTALAGTAANPLVMAVEYSNGSGGNALVVPARNEHYGAASGGSAASFYQAFGNGDRFDLISLTMTPDNPTTPTRYTVAHGAAVIDGSMFGPAPVSTTDDAIVPIGLGFVFRFPGGSTSNIQVSTNGYVWLDGATITQDFTPTVGEFLGTTAANPARLAPFWTDLHCGRNVGTFPNAGFTFLIDTSGGIGNRACWLTWKDVGVFNQVAAGGIVSCTMQCVIRENGTVEYRYSGMPRFCSTASQSPDTLAGLVGFTRGRIGVTPSVDPVTRDLSLETPFLTAIEGNFGNLLLTPVTTPAAGGAVLGGRLFAGQSVTWNVSNVPPNAILGAQLIDIATNRPGFQLPGITAPGCMLSTSANAQLWEVNLLPGLVVNGTRPLAIPPGFDGFQLSAQYVVLNGLFTGPDLITSASNALLHTVGRQ